MSDNSKYKKTKNSLNLILDFEQIVKRHNSPKTDKNKLPIKEKNRKHLLLMECGVIENYFISMLMMIL